MLLLNCLVIQLTKAINCKQQGTYVRSAGYIEAYNRHPRSNRNTYISMGCLHCLFQSKVFTKQSLIYNSTFHFSVCVVWPCTQNIFFPRNSDRILQEGCTGGKWLISLLSNCRNNDYFSAVVWEFHCEVKDSGSNHQDGNSSMFKKNKKGAKMYKFLAE